MSAPSTSDAAAVASRDLKNDAEWLRMIADGADVIPDHGDDMTGSLVNQWLWPETRDNLREVANAITDMQGEVARLQQIERRAVEILDAYCDIPGETDEDVSFSDGAFRAAGYIRTGDKGTRRELTLLQPSSEREDKTNH